MFFLNEIWFNIISFLDMKDRMQAKYPSENFDELSPHSCVVCKKLKYFYRYTEIKRHHAHLLIAIDKGFFCSKMCIQWAMKSNRSLGFINRFVVMDKRDIYPITKDLVWLLKRFKRLMLYFPSLIHNRIISENTKGDEAISGDEMPRLCQYFRCIPHILNPNEMVCEKRYLDEYYIPRFWQIENNYYDR